MAIVVEDGSVVVGANSYVSVAYADTYFEIDEEFAEIWDEMDTEAKEIRLRWATRVLDQKVVWRGTKTVENSPLRWPRTGVFDRDGNAVGNHVMPDQLLQVTCELAKFLATSNPTTSQGGDALKRLVVDVVEIEYQEGVVQADTPPIFNQLLRGLGTFPIVGGSSFERIRKA